MRKNSIAIIKIKNFFIFIYFIFGEFMLPNGVRVILNISEFSDSNSESL